MFPLCRIDKDGSLDIGFNEWRNFLLFHPTADLREIITYWRHSTVMSLQIKQITIERVVKILREKVYHHIGFLRHTKVDRDIKSRSICHWEPPPFQAVGGFFSQTSQQHSRKRRRDVTDSKIPPTAFHVLVTFPKVSSRAPTTRTDLLRFFSVNLLVETNPQRCADAMSSLSQLPVCE